MKIYTQEIVKFRAENGKRYGAGGYAYNDKLQVRPFLDGAEITQPVDFAKPDANAKPEFSPG